MIPKPITPPPSSTLVSNGIVSPARSACLEEACQQQHLDLGNPRKIDIRALFFMRPVGSPELGSWAFREGGMSYGPLVAEAVWCRAAASDDPVQSYLAVHFASGDLLELVEWTAKPRVSQFFAGGKQFGWMIKLPSPFKERPWWQQLFAPFERHTWLVSLHDRLHGEVGFKYPVDNSSRMWIEWSEHPALPINLGFVPFDDWTNLVIPHDTPVVQEPDMLRLHFLLSVFFRSMFSIDFPS